MILAQNSSAFAYMAPGIAPPWLIYGGIGLLIAAIALIIVRAMRATQHETDKFLGTDPGKRADRAKALADHLRSLDVKCPYCGLPADTVIGSGNRFRCPQCLRQFEGPSHLPDSLDDDRTN